LARIHKVIQVKGTSHVKEPKIGLKGSLKPGEIVGEIPEVTKKKAFVH